MNAANKLLPRRMRVAHCSVVYVRVNCLRYMAVCSQCQLVWLPLLYKNQWETPWMLYSVRYRRHGHIRNATMAMGCQCGAIRMRAGLLIRGWVGSTTTTVTVSTTSACQENGPLVPTS